MLASLENSTDSLRPHQTVLADVDRLSKNGNRPAHLAHFHIDLLRWILPSLIAGVREKSLHSSRGGLQIVAADLRVFPCCMGASA